MKEKQLLILIFIVFVILRLIPYINDPVPTGYDGGIYIHAIKSFPNLPPWLVQSFYSALFLITWPIKLIGLDSEKFIVPLAFLVQFVFFTGLFVCVKKISDYKTALAAVFLLAVSAIQIRAYWFFYLKYILSMAFFLLFLAFLGKRSYYKAMIFGILTAATHLLLFGIMIIVFLIDLLIDKSNRFKKLFCLSMIMLIGLIFYLPYFNETIINNFKPVFSSLFSVSFADKEGGGGTFYPVYLSLLLTGLYLPLAIYGIWKTVKVKSELRPLLITLILTILLIVLKVSFFRRIFIITDAILIIYAALGFSLVWEMRKYYIVILLIFGLVFTLKTGDKLITHNNLEEISALKGIINNGFLLSTSKENTAWLLGYTDARVIAWGYGGYNIYWTDGQWKNFLTWGYPVEKKRKLLLLLPPQSYFYIDDNTSKRLDNLIHSSYLKQISEHVFLVNN